MGIQLTYFRLLAVATGLTFVLSTKAQTIEQPILKLLQGNKGQVKKDSLVMVEDDKWWIPAEKSKLDLTGAYRIKNIISLKLNEDSAVVLKPKFTVWVRIKLFITNSSGTIDSSQTPYLSITYDTLTGANYNSQSVMSFFNAYRVAARILSVDSSYEPVNVSPKPPVTPFIRLENEMQITREYNFSCTAATMVTIGGGITNLPATGEVDVSWSPIAGATEYDLEWVYIDSALLLNPSLYKTSDTLDPSKIFIDNSTRVTISGASYKIPMLYPDSGILFERFRPVQVKPNGQRYEGKWSCDKSVNVANGLGQVVNFAGHEPNLNWQATTSFAEDGKRKSVVQYYDGTLRSRQTVTKDNTLDTTVVAETLYDYQGRAVIQVLPAPTLSSIISYSRNFNRRQNSENVLGYTKDLYDTLLNKSDYCQTPAPPMGKDSSGASRYYSNQNPSAAIGFNKFIPDAQLYPFTETRYTQDNTGRVLSQSGVGDNFKIGSGHETKYFYGNPDQREIDGLFGTEVGYASHYFKNMVRDANGQYSVSYVDMHGRTIATALAGKSPTALDTIASYNKKTITEKLSDTTNNIVKDLVMESSRSILVTDSVAYNFNYTLTPDSIRLKTCANTNVCYDCLYNLEITITDECNNCHLPGQKPYVVVDSNFTFTNIDTICNTITGFNKNFTVGLPEGNYTITKKLSISRYGLDYYRDSVFVKKNTCRTFNDFYKQVSDSIRAQMDCSTVSCDSCTARTGSLATFRVYYLNSIGIALSDSAQFRDDIVLAYTQAREECSFICGNTGEHTYIRTTMLQDMTAPSGQYANPDSVFTRGKLYNIFDPQNLSWKIPVYHDEYGKLDSLVNENGILVPVNQISQAQFIGSFKSAWANDLLIYHPEYLKLLEYEKHISSHIWDEDFGAVDTYAEANSKGYLIPVDLTTSQRPYPHLTYIFANLDPLAKTDSLLSAMQQKVSLFSSASDNLSLWGVASVSGKCGNVVNCASNYTNTLLNNCINPAGFCTGELDMSWRSFRQIYLTTKRRMLMDKLHQQYPYVRLHIPPFRNEHFASSTADGESYYNNISTQNTSQVVNTINGKSQEFYQQNCSDLAASWWSRLAPCNLTYNDSLKLIPRMVAICVAGSDAAHTFGSSSAAPGSTLTYKTFEQLIKFYMDSMNAIYPSQYKYNYACNADLINTPEPYDQQTSMSNISIWNRPDSCQCSTISSYYGKYKQYGSSDANFSAYLLRVNGTQIADADLTKLLNMCNGIDTCKFLTVPITLPPVLQCGIKDVCITCTQVQNAFNVFKTKYPGVYPSYADDDSLQALKNQAFANSMNKTLGFTKPAADYLNFMNNCPVQYAADSIYNDSLKIILVNYQDNIFNSNTLHADSSGCDTSFIKINNGGWLHDKRFRLGEWIENGVFSMPEKDTLLQPSTLVSTNYNYVDTICLNNQFTVESRFKMPFIQEHFQRYVNIQGGSATSNNIYGTEFHEFHFNNMSVQYWLARGTLFYPGHGDSMYAYLIIDTNGVNIVNHRNISTGLARISNWATIKVELKNNVAKFYLNGVVIDTAIYSTPITKFYSMAIDPYGYDLNVDWIKMYDGTNTLRYFEDFNGCGSLGKQTLPRCTPDCQQGFVNYFNTLKGINYTFTQIDTSYFNRLGIHPNPCTDDPKNCGILQAAVTEYNTSLLTIPKDTDGAEKGIFTMAQNPWYPVSKPYYDTANAHPSMFIKNGIIASVPDSIDKYNVGNTLDFCTGPDLAFEFRVKRDSAQARRIGRLTNSELIPAIFFESGSLTYVINASYANVTGTIYPNYVMNATALVNMFDAWTTVKIVIVNDSAYVYYNGVKKHTASLKGLPARSKITGYSWSNVCSYNIDWVKIYDNQGVLKYQEDFNDVTNFAKVPSDWVCPPAGCSTGFTTFFNNKFSTSLTAAQISKLYQQCGKTDAACGVNEPMLCGKNEPLFPDVAYTEASPCADSTNMIFAKATELYRAYLDSLNNAFDSAYLLKCKKAFRTESFTVTHQVSEYHYTLYYYDQAGNLVKTIAPGGVDLISRNRTTWLDSVVTFRKNGTRLVPVHAMPTNYRYNSLNQVMAQNTPDAGGSTFFYDRLGRLVISQNAKQYANSGTELNRQYSYTRYDLLGRIAEVGQLTNATTNVITQTITSDTTLFKNWFTSASNTNVNIAQVTRTYYDNKYGTPIGSPVLYPKNLRNRVAYTSYTDGNNQANYNAATFYSYDIHGNVDTLLQDYGSSSMPASQNIMNMNLIGDNRWKRVVYRYDLISGKVNSVAYQPQYISAGVLNRPQDAFYHRYSYDAENRLTLVETSADSTVWERDARYSYYKHGPLARMVLGQQQVQGVDYAYTTQGWLKGENSTTLSIANDMGKDGDAANAATKYIARDALSFNLNYFNGDYVTINANNPFALTTASNYLATSNYRPLYNGNISSMAVNIRRFNSTTGVAGDSALLYNYRYDQLNRIVALDAYRGLNTGTNAWGGSMSPLAQYSERLSYDANGNILKLNRHGDQAGANVTMDSLTYYYYSNTNKLLFVQDIVPDTRYADDIDHQTSVPNYYFDAIGNLVQDNKEGITSILWNVYGKIQEINKLDSSSTLINRGRVKKITYSYDASGNRISKKVENYANSTINYTWYVLDASGNILTNYSYTSTTATDLSANNLTQTDVYLFGSSRLGSFTLNRNVEVTAQSIDSSFTSPLLTDVIRRWPFFRGMKQYELTNHLGNVLATISDKKIGVSSNGTNIDYYTADVITATDYYPGGMQMPGRKYLAPNASKPRYGFNGKENDNEVKGEGNQQDYGMRIYDPRLVRFLSVDPLTKKYPELTPYQFASNTPIAAVDLDGLEATISVEKNTYFVTLKNINFRFVQRKSIEYFIQSTKDFPRHDFSINTQMFDYKSSIDYFWATTPQPYNDYTPQGQNVAHGQVVSGRSADKTFNFAHNKDGSWSTGYGDVPKDAKFGVGGGTPIVINGLNFGSENVFADNAPENVKKIGVKGWVDPADWKYLKQKSNGVYAGQNDATVGKTILGFNSKTNEFIIVSQQNGKEGFTLDQIRNRLVGQGYNNVLAFDGSTSSTLVENGKALVSPDKRKNSTIPSGLNLSVPDK